MTRTLTIDRLEEILELIESSVRSVTQQMDLDKLDPSLRIEVHLQTVERSVLGLRPEMELVSELVFPLDDEGIKLIQQLTAHLVEGAAGLTGILELMESPLPTVTAPRLIVPH